MAKPDSRAGLDRLEAAASLLKPIERQVLFLSARHGLRNEEIASRLRITPEAAEGHLADALYDLARHLERAERPWWKIW